MKTAATLQAANPFLSPGLVYGTSPPLTHLTGTYVLPTKHRES